MTNICLHCVRNYGPNHHITEITPTTHVTHIHTRHHEQFGEDGENWPKSDNVSAASPLKQGIESFNSFVCTK